MSRTLRVFYRAQQGRIRKNVNWSPITEKSAVIITAAEWHATGGLFGAEVGRYHLGEADVYVTNIGPHDDEGGGQGGVEFHLHVDSASPVDVVVAITVLEPYESFISA